MKYIFFLLSLFSITISGCTQQKKYSQWTLIALGNNDALVFENELKAKEQVRYISIDDEENIARIKWRVEKEKQPLWLIVKAADSSIVISSSYQADLRKYFGQVEKLTVEPLKEKEKEILAWFRKEYPDGF